MDKNQLQSDQDEYLKKKHDFIPLSPKLIEHVRRIDGFNVSNLVLSNSISQEEELI